MPDFSALMYKEAGQDNLLSGGFEGARVKWTTTTTWGPLPSVYKKVRTHSGVTLNVPYMFGVTADYPCGYTAAIATNILTNIIIFPETHASAGYFEGCVAGYYASVASSGLTAGMGLECINSGVTAIDSGVTAPLRTSADFAIALAATASSKTAIWMYGDAIEVKSS